ncbi:MAG: efflux RND transporter periplasmic adaptor subunit [Pseudomonadota bacterium]
MPRSVITAGIILFVLLAYFGLRTAFRSDPADTAPAAEASEARADVRPQAVVRPVLAEPHEVFESLKGRTEAERLVVVRSATTGTVVEAPAREGRIVSSGSVLCRLDVEARAVQVEQAEANLASKTLDWEAARDLAEKGWTSATSAAAAKAAYDAAVAAVDAARIEMERTILRAPFAGVFDERMAEVGDFLAPGGACGQMLDLSPILVVVEATEAQAGRIALGQTAAVTLADGRALEGTVRYVARTANAATRTFRVELAVPNPDYAIAAGLTASLRLKMGEAPAVLLSPALLVLHDDGRVGVRHVDDADTVQFAEVRVIDDADTGIWVAGLPDQARVLAAGQDYVREGIEVVPVVDEGL